MYSCKLTGWATNTTVIKSTSHSSEAMLFLRRFVELLILDKKWHFKVEISLLLATRLQTCPSGHFIFYFNYSLKILGYLHTCWPLRELDYSKDPLIKIRKLTGKFSSFTLDLVHLTPPFSGKDTFGGIAGSCKMHEGWDSARSVGWRDLGSSWLAKFITRARSSEMRMTPGHNNNMRVQRVCHVAWGGQLEAKVATNQKWHCVKVC